MTGMREVETLVSKLNQVGRKNIATQRIRGSSHLNRKADTHNRVSARQGRRILDRVSRLSFNLPVVDIEAEDIDLGDQEAPAASIAAEDADDIDMDPNALDSDEELDAELGIDSTGKGNDGDYFFIQQ
jgi:hypothetical protein